MTKIIRLIYVLSIIAIGLLALVSVVSAFHSSTGAGFLVLLIIAPAMSLFLLVYVRVLLELFIALMRIMENTGELVVQGRSSSSM
jgi:Domain of unknown function (DUF4282)